MKKYLIIEYDRQCLQPNIKMVHPLIVGIGETLKQKLADQFNDGDFTFIEQLGIINISDLTFSNTSDVKFGDLIFKIIQ